MWLIVKLGGVAVALGALYKYIWRPFKKNVLDKLNDFYNKVNYITAELKPNGGNSLRDQVNYIKRTVEKIDQRQLNFFHFDPHGIVETDATGNLIWANRAFLDLVRRHPEEVHAQGWRNCIAEFDRERVVKEWQAAVADSRDFFTRCVYIDSFGQEIRIEARYLAMRSASDKLIGHLGVVVREEDSAKLAEISLLPQPRPSAR